MELMCCWMWFCWNFRVFRDDSSEVAITWCIRTIVTSFQAVIQKCDKVHELPKIPKGLVCFVGKNGVLTCVLYMPDVIDSEDLTVIIFTGFQPPSPAVLAHYTSSCSYVLACWCAYSVASSSHQIVALPLWIWSW